jgi:Lrp/AsnC family leucine-responsive transcriptional regulator
MTKTQKLDELDVAILRELQKDCRVPLQVIAAKVKSSTSTVHYRVKRLEREGIIDGYYAHINPEKVGMDYITIIKIMASYGPKYYERIGNDLRNIPGIWAVYYSLGEQDFFVLTRSKDRIEFMETLDKVMSTKGIERTATQVIAKVVLEDPRLQI